MAAVSNYSLHPRGPRWLIYSEALGGAVRRTPSLPLCWLTVLDGSHSICDYGGEGGVVCIFIQYLPFFS